MFKDCAGIFLIQLALLITGLIFGIILARSLSMNDMGYYQLILSYMAIGQILAIPGMNEIISKGVLRDYDPIYFAVLKRSLCTTIISALVIFLICGILYFQQKGSICLALLIVGTFLPVMGMEKHGSFLKGKRKFLLSRRIIFFTSILNLIIVGGTAYFTKSIISMFIALFITRVAVLTICLKIVTRLIIKKNIDNKLEGDLLKQGWQLSILNVFNLIVGQIDRIIIGVIDPSLLAIYHIGCLLPRKIKDNVKTILVVPMTHWAKLSKKEHFYKIKKHGYKFFLLGTILTISIWILSPYIIPFFYGNNYYESVQISRLISLTLPCLFIGTIILDMDIYHGDTSYYQKVVIITQISSLVLLCITIPQFGIYGVIISFVVRAYIQHLIFPLYYLVKSRGQTR